MTKREMEKRLEEYLNERYQAMQIAKSNKSAYETNKTFYEGVCAAIAQIGEWERQWNDGKHFVKLN